MLALLVPAAFALSIPVRATYTERVLPGEAPIAGSATTATVALSNPATGAYFALSADELTANKREASGAGEIAFAGDPAGSIRTWAIHYLDESGALLGDPEIVDVLFDENGSGSIAARDGAPRTRDVQLVAALDGSATLRISAQDSGADAVLVGIAELTSADAGAPLLTDPDMTVLDAGTYAAFQELLLDAVVALDTYRVQVEGEVAAEKLAVGADGSVESGAELQWDLSFYAGLEVCRGKEPAACEPVPSLTASYLEPVGAVKKRSGRPPAVTLKPADMTFDTWNAGFSLVFDADVRELEVVGRLDVYDGDALAGRSEVISLDPGSVGVQAKEDDDEEDTGMIVDIFIDTDCEDCGDYDFTAPGTPPAWTFVADDLIEIAILDSAGEAVSGHLCSLAPTSRTLEGAVKGGGGVLIGECTRDVADTEVRRLRAEVGPRGHVTWSVDLAGPAFTGERRATTCSKVDGCTEEAVSVLGGKVELYVDGRRFFSEDIDVAETTFDLPFAFMDDIDGLNGDLTVDVYASVPVTWSVDSGAASAKAADGAVVARFDLEGVDLERAGDCRLDGWQAIDATPQEQSVGGPAEGWLRLTGTGPGRRMCSCKPGFKGY